MWATQAQVDEDTQAEIQELKTAIKWVGGQLIDLQKQVILKCDWNSTQFCITPVHFIVPTTGNKDFICKIYMIMPL